MPVQLAPVESQRCHPYERLSGGVPVQAPPSVVSDSPNLAAPEMVGRATFVGGAAATGAVGSELASAAPPPFDATTSMRIEKPMSLGESVYVGAVAPSIEPQVPAALQRSH